MSQIHTFQRPDAPLLGPQVGETYSPEHKRYDEGARYAYQNEAHDLVLFWANPSQAEIEGLRGQPVEVGLYNHGPAAFLLYKIQNVCEWSDVAFNIQLVPEAERALPAEPPGERARLRITLVNADNGIVQAKRLVSLDRVMTQALRHTMQEQADQAFNRLLYDAAVQEAHGRFPDGDAMAHAAEAVEATLG